jgi:predicted enzyme related to lactoylglutathione lyase
MQRAQAFYEAVLQLKLEKMTMPVGMEDGLVMFAFPSDMQRF